MGTISLARRRIREDGPAMKDATTDTSWAYLVPLAPGFAQIYLELVQVFVNTHRSFDIESRRVIYEKYSKTDSSTIDRHLVKRGLAKTLSHGTTHPALLTPLFDQRVVFSISTGKVVHPPDLHGCKVDDPRMSRYAELKPYDPYESVRYWFGESASCLPPSHKPFVTKGIQLNVLTAIYEMMRSQGYTGLLPGAVRNKSVELGCKHPHSAMANLEEEHIVTRFKAGTFREVLYRPYLDASGNLIIPPECYKHPSVATVEHQTEDPLPETAPSPMILSKGELRARLHELSSLITDREKTIEECSRAVETYKSLEAQRIDLQTELDRVKEMLGEFATNPLDEMRALIDQQHTDKQICVQLRETIEHYEAVLAVLLRH